VTRRIPRNRAQRRLDRPARKRYATRTLTVEVHGDRPLPLADPPVCRGRLYLPAGAEDPPAVVLAPELGADAAVGLPAFAERLAAAGYAAFRFDYRGFGASDGDDRLVAPARQRADLAAALDRMDGVDDVGDGRVAMGPGLGGNHALAVAADRGDVDAAVALTPIADGRAFLRRRGIELFLRTAAAGVRDAVGHRVGLGREVPVVGDPDSSAAIAAPGAKRAYLDLVDRDGDWRNAAPARSLVALAREEAVPDPESLRTPALLLAGETDELVPADAVADLADRLPRGTLVRMPADHWSVYAADFEPVVGHVLAFLTDALDASGTGAHGAAGDGETRPAAPARD